MTTGRKLSRFTPLSAAPQEDYRDAFLIGDLLPSSMTSLTGEPKAGKSLLMAGIVQALTEGWETFLGQPVHRQIDSVVYGITDDGADSELASRLRGTDAFDKVYVEPMFGMSDESWAILRERVLDERPGLVVVDNVLGALSSGEDIASNTTGHRFVGNLRPIREACIPVVLVTHTPKGNTEGLTTASSVIGSRTFAAGSRGVIALRKSQRDGLRLQTSINRATRDLDLAVSVERAAEGSEVPVWSVRTGGTRADAEVTPGEDWSTRLVALVLEDQPPAGTSANALAHRYAEKLGKSPDTVRRKVSELVKHDGTAWKATAA